MSKILRMGRLVLGVLTLAVAVGSCGKVGEPQPLFDSNTNWLLRCVDDGQCDGSLRCYCGICTKPCGQDAECALLSGAQCAESGEGLCGEQASAGGLCVLACTQASDCGDGFNCAAGQCVPIPAPAPASSACNGTGLDQDWDGVFQIINTDLARADADDRSYLRYFNLGNRSGDPDAPTDPCAAELDLERQGLTKLMNSLSLQVTTQMPSAIDVDERLYRIDLRDFQWDRPVSVGDEDYDDAWEALIANDPYAIPFVGDDAQDASVDTGTAVPVLLADSFFATATQPEVYYGLLEIPDRLDDLLVNDLGLDPADPAAVEAGFVDEVEFLAQTWPLEVRSGYLWLISDFGRGPGALFANPLDSAQGEREIIFTLPNGLDAFAFMSSGGQRIDGWSATPDARERDGVARAPRTNLRRHPRTLTVRDEVRDYVDANPALFNESLLRLIRQRFPGSQQVALLVERDYVAFPGPALLKLAVSTAGPEPILQGVDAFARRVTLQVAAAELLVTPRDLLDNLNLLDPRLLALDGGSLVRDVFTSLYLPTLCTLSVVLENQPEPSLCP
jgi:hypothetical protein